MRYHHVAAALLLGPLTALSAFAPLAHAQEWPIKPIRMIVGYPAGGGLDFVGRTVAHV